MNEKNFIIFDLETTGLNFSYDEIIEVAGQKVVDGQVVDTYHALVQPSKPISQENQEIHNISQEELNAKGKSPNIIIPEFMKFIEDYPLMGHNILLFDVPFLNAYLLKLNMPLLKNKIIDTLNIARQTLKLPSYSLESLSVHFGISYDGAHRALQDVKINLEVYQRLTSQMQRSLF